MPAWMLPCSCLGGKEKGMKLCVECAEKLNEVKGKIALLEESQQGLVAKIVEVEE